MPHFCLKSISCVLLFLLAGCSSSSWMVDKAGYLFLFNGSDEPVSAEVLRYQQGSEQAAITPAIRGAAAQLEGESRRERMLKAVDYIWKNFKYDNRKSHLAFSRTADELFQSGSLGGCSDFALAQTVLFRALDIPARLVVTADVEWMQSYKKNNLVMTRGHVFIEVYLENRWYLVDIAYRKLFLDYRSFHASYPRNQYFIYRGMDYWEMGLTNVEAVDRMLQEKALAYQPGKYNDPDYPHAGI